MTYYEAIMNLKPEHLAKFLDQVFLTGFNTGYHSLVDPDIHDGINPFNPCCLNSVVEGSPTLVKDEEGKALIIDQLTTVVGRIAEFDADTISEESLTWQVQVVLPKDPAGE